jgi:hypothetical protein
LHQLFDRLWLISGGLEPAVQLESISHGT